MRLIVLMSLLILVCPGTKASGEQKSIPKRVPAIRPSKFMSDPVLANAVREITLTQLESDKEIRRIDREVGKVALSDAKLAVEVSDIEIRLSRLEEKLKDIEDRVGGAHTGLESAVEELRDKVRRLEYR